LMGRDLRENPKPASLIKTGKNEDT